MIRALLTKVISVLLLIMMLKAAFAEDGEIEISASVALMSDYVFRGYSQTTRDPAIQGGFDIDFGNGFAIGTWSSNINFGDSSSQEIDLYASFGKEMSKTMSWSMSFTQFRYPSEGEALNYQEFGFSLGINDLSIGLIYSPEYLGNGGPSWNYPYADYSIPLADISTVDLHIGINFAEDDFFDDGDEVTDSYIDYAATLTYSAATADFSIGMAGSSNNAGKSAEPHLIIGISKSL